MGDGDRRVCPRCGSDAGQEEYCQTCGLHLWGQKELPTRTAWEAEQAAKASTPTPAAKAEEAVGRVRDASDRVSAWWSLRGRGEKLGLAAAGVAAVAAVAFGASKLGEDDGSSANLGRGNFGASGPSGRVERERPAQRCVDSWNAASGSDNPGSSIYGHEQAYAAVGFSVDFPDQCLVTIAIPDYGQASQFQETSPGEWRYQGGGPIETVPASAKQWNATRAADGTLSFGAPYGG